MTRETVVLDTNILLRDCTIPFTMKDTDIILPQIVIQEMDKKKTSPDRSVGYNARAFCRKIKKLMKEQGTTNLKLNGNTTLTIVPWEPSFEGYMKTLGLDSTIPDHIIVATAHSKEARLSTGDTNMWITALSLGVKVDDYEVSSQFQSLYSGVRVIELDDTELIDNVYAGKKICLNEDEFPGLHSNQVLVFKSLASRHSSLIVIFKGYDLPLRRIKNF